MLDDLSLTGSEKQTQDCPHEERELTDGTKAGRLSVLRTSQRRTRRTVWSWIITRRLHSEAGCLLHLYRGSLPSPRVFVGATTAPNHRVCIPSQPSSSPLKCYAFARAQAACCWQVGTETRSLSGTPMQRIIYIDITVQNVPGSYWYTNMSCITFSHQHALGCPLRPQWRCATSEDVLGVRMSTNQYVHQQLRWQGGSAVNVMNFCRHGARDATGPRVYPSDCAVHVNSTERTSSSIF